jgi:hypothetical protein
MEIGQTASGPARVLQHAPEAFARVQVVATMGREEGEAKPPMAVREGGGELVGPMDPTAIDDHHALLLGFPKDAPDLMHILAQGFCVKMRHDLREDF